jgi:ADP-ribose pyrophosphatase
MIEVVAGMLAEGEDKEACAIRESIEEAGYRPENIRFLGKTYTSPGGTSECLYMYLGEVDKDKPVSAGGGLDEEHEDIRSFWVSREEAVRMATDGRINSSVPMLAVMLAFGVQGVVG